MTAQDLTQGALQDMVRGRACGPDFHPVLQVLDLRMIPPTPQVNHQRYRLIVSDGQHYAQSMLATQFNNLVTSGELQMYCLIRLDNFIINNVNNRKIIVCLNVVVTSPPTGGELGKPQPLAELNQSGGGGQQQQQQPQRQMQQQQQQRFGQQQQQFGGQQGNSNFAGRYNRPGSASGINALNVVPVNSLNPYRGKWTIKVRVTSKSDVRTWNNANGSGKLMSVDLLDKDGGEIRATMFKQEVDKFQDVFQTNQVYLISGGRIKPANKRYSALKNDYEITLDSNTMVEPVNDDQGIKTQQYEFVGIAKLVDVQENSHVDICGVVTRVDPLAQIMSQRTNKQLEKRTIQISDKTGQIELTLWSAAANKYNEQNLGGNPVVCVKNARVSDFGGRSLSMTGSSMEVNADLPKVFELKGWYEGEGRDAKLPSLSTGYQNASVSNNDTWLFLNEIKERQLGQRQDNKPDYFVCKGTVTSIRSDISKPPYYLACKGMRDGRQCNKKVISRGMPQGDGMPSVDPPFWCEGCNQEYQECEPRYVLNFAVNDHTGQTYFSAFNDIGEKLLGAKAEQMHEFVRQQNDSAFQQMTNDAQFQTKIFKCRAKYESYNDENRLKCTVVHMEDVDWVDESQKLIMYIQQNKPGIQQQQQAAPMA